VIVRDATEDDAVALSQLWHELLRRPGLQPAPAASSGTSSAAPPPEEVARQAVSRTEGDPASRILVAELDGRVVGCASLRTIPTSPLHEENVVRMSHLQVDPAHTRRGAGRSLVAAALSWAEQQGVETLLVASPVDDRDANRIFARMGLAPVASMRGAPVTALRARMAQDASAAGRQAGRGRNVGQVVAARRSQRRARAGRLAL
jgi:N-acetylglutamate synthase-like GNAT family acetyltransferase